MQEAMPVKAGGWCTGMWRSGRFANRGYRNLGVVNPEVGMICTSNS